MLPLTSTISQNDQHHHYLPGNDSAPNVSPQCTSQATLPHTFPHGSLNITVKTNPPITITLKITMVFYAEENSVPIPTKDIPSWIFDGARYDQDQPVSLNQTSIPNR